MSDDIIIILGKDFFSLYWGSAGEWSKHGYDYIELVSEKLLESHNVIISKELKDDIKRFNVIAFAENYHDCIATVDDTTSKFETKCTSVEESLMETGKMYLDTHNVIFLTNCTKLKELIQNDQEFQSRDDYAVVSFQDFLNFELK